MWLPRALLAASLASGVLAGAGSAAEGAKIATPGRLVGQSIMTGMNGRVPGRELLARIRAGQVGGVILFPRNIGSTRELARAIDVLQAAAADGGNQPLLIAVDQEGGAVNRLPAG